MLRKLREYFDKTPRSQVLKDWEETKELTKDIISPTMDEFMSWNRIAGEPRRPTLRIQGQSIELTQVKTLSAEKYNSQTTLYMCC